MGVGKSCLFVRLFCGEFSHKHVPATVEWNEIEFPIDGYEVSVNMMDLAGTDDFAEMRLSWLAKCDAYILMYSLASRESFLKVERYRKEILLTERGEDLPILLVGNQLDRDDDREVSEEEGRQKALEWGYSYTEMSVKYNVGVSEALRMCVREIMRTRQTPPSSDPSCSIL